MQIVTRLTKRGPLRGLWDNCQNWRVTRPSRVTRLAQVNRLTDGGRTAKCEKFQSQVSVSESAWQSEMLAHLKNNIHLSPLSVLCVFSILLFCVCASYGPWMVIGKVLYQTKKIDRDISHSQYFVIHHLSILYKDFFMFLQHHCNYLWVKIVII